MIKKVKGGFVLHRDGQQLPGVYENLEAAKVALSLNSNILQSRFGKHNGVVTVEMLKNLPSNPPLSPAPVLTNSQPDEDEEEDDEEDEDEEEDDEEDEDEEEDDED